MKPVINVVHAGIHCGHNHKTVRSATHCRRFTIGQRSKGLADDLPTLQAFTLDARGRYVKVAGNLVTA